MENEAIRNQKLIEMWKVALNRPGISPVEKETAEKAIAELSGEKNEDNGNDN